MSSTIPCDAPCHASYSLIHRGGFLTLAVLGLGPNSLGPADSSFIIGPGSWSCVNGQSGLMINNVKEKRLDIHEKAKEAIFYSYNKHINGFAALLEEEKAAEIAKNPIVVSVFENKGYKLMTTRSWEFLGLESSNGIVYKDSIWEKAKYGVWPESMSFSDEGMGPVPTKWRGICQLDNFRCNRDTLGHGTQTLSIAGGNFVRSANVFGLGNGTAKGGSPKAHVAAYKVCWANIRLDCT
ncbi:hypothetical protein PIB30_039166 [Stylosanthes scabra]|uniref:Inhibitor I9 domain-containing protein n=1 Tax=Stylosanthes scabra TaxID=79078 RepID=A0ABU6WCD0_9FABA|nr:hypothetical protein [Stylosanthes scabra]